MNEDLIPKWANGGLVGGSDLIASGSWSIPSENYWVSGDMSLEEDTEDTPILEDEEIDGLSIEEVRDVLRDYRNALREAQESWEEERAARIAFQEENLKLKEGGFGVKEDAVPVPVPVPVPTEEFVSYTPSDARLMKDIGRRVLSSDWGLPGWP